MPPGRKTTLIKIGTEFAQTSVGDGFIVTKKKGGVKLDPLRRNVPRAETKNTESFRLITLERIILDD